MNDTPETDAVAKVWEQQGVRNGIADFARNLERQRNMLLDALDLMVESFEHEASANNPSLLNAYKAIASVKQESPCVGKES